MDDFFWDPLSMRASSRLKVSNRSTKEWCKIYSKLTIKTPDRRQFDNFFC